MIEGADVVVNLSGENVAGGRWSAERRRAILDSRIEGTSLLARTMAAAKKKPSSFISASAIGYYGDAGDTVLDESSPSGDGFLAEVCRAWETATKAAADAGVRTEPLRNADFTRALGEALHRPAFVPVPAFAIKAAMGDMGREVLLSSQRVKPVKLTASGFVFACPDVPTSLARQLAGS